MEQEDLRGMRDVIYSIQVQGKYLLCLCRLFRCMVCGLNIFSDSKTEEE